MSPEAVSLAAGRTAPRLGRLISRSIAALTLAVVGLAVHQAPASAATISSDHVDVLDVDTSGSSVSLNIKTYSPANDNVNPVGTTLAVPASTLTTVPSGVPACLGAAGSAVYRLPQSQQSGILYAGWNTEDASATTTLELDVANSTVPVGGKFALYTTGLAYVSVKFNTNTAPGCMVASFPGGIPAGSHGHAYWTFSKKGTYVLKFRATVGANSSGWISYTFAVG